MTFLRLVYERNCLCAFGFFSSATQFGQLLAHLDTTQQMINNSLKDNSTLLTQVLTGLRSFVFSDKILKLLFCSNMSLCFYVQVQQTMKENLVSVEENFAALDQRIKKLSK